MRRRIAPFAAGLVLLLSGCVAAAPAGGGEASPGPAGTPDAAQQEIDLSDFCEQASDVLSEVSNAGLGLWSERITPEDWHARILAASASADALLAVAPSGTEPAVQAVVDALAALPVVPEGDDPTEPAHQAFGRLRSICDDAGSELVVHAEWGG
ncbi:MAG: hypothetical protein J7484_14285 [Microbacterium sp.]|nr:hypothetical protein [Microbacterium sp.]